LTRTIKRYHFSAIAFFLLSFFSISCSTEENHKEEKQIEKIVIAEEPEYTDPHDTLSFHNYKKIQIKDEIRIEIDGQYAIVFDESIDEDYYSSFRFTFFLKDTFFVNLYSHRLLSDWGDDFVISGIRMAANDPLEEKCSFILDGGRYATDDLRSFYIVYNYRGKELLFDDFIPDCSFLEENRFGYVLTCNGIFRFDEQIALPVKYPIYLAMPNANTVFFVDHDEKDNAVFYDLKSREIIKTFTFDGIYEALGYYTSIAEYENPYRLIVMTDDQQIRIFNSNLSEKKIKLTDLPEEKLSYNEENTVYLSSDDGSFILRMNEEGFPVARSNH
jgi:hypothetical protein